MGNFTVGNSICRWEVVRKGVEVSHNEGVEDYEKLLFFRKEERRKRTS